MRSMSSLGSLGSLVFSLAAVLAACHSEPAPHHPTEGEVPPLPPSSGTPVGYLVDAQTDLKLRDEQLKQLKDIDASLAASEADIDTQLRQIERPEEEEQQSPQDQKAGVKRPRYNHAPGASVKTNGDAAKLHEARAAHDRDALKKAWALLDPDQRTSAQKILEARGVEVPGSQKTKAPTGTDDGTPLPGMGEP